MAGPIASFSIVGHRDVKRHIVGSEHLSAPCGAKMLPNVLPEISLILRLRMQLESASIKPSLLLLLGRPPEFQS